MEHSFYIPVMGLAFTVDTPLKVAKYGISSAISIVDDELLERMRAHYCKQARLPYTPILKQEEDSRARRITAYLNLADDLVQHQLATFKQEGFEEGSGLHDYFAYLPDTSILKQQYRQMQLLLDAEKRTDAQKQLLEQLEAGYIDVNIMSKVDKANETHRGALPEQFYSDALAALRGFAQSKLRSSVILSAGMNTRLYSYLSEWEDFYPMEDGTFKKTVILKVSDYRSALIQAKFLAKRGIWVSEFRVESGLNCGGHAFATEGHLLGPILEVFKQQRASLYEELYGLLCDALLSAGRVCPERLAFRITAQGGVGTHVEHLFLMSYYGLDAIGWGSPFLLVPEATNVDAHTLQELMDAEPDDFYVSDVSPLGVPFNYFRRSSAEQLRHSRIAAGIPGSPCDKRYLVSNTEFTKTPICTASRAYQRLKINQLKKDGLSGTNLKVAIERVQEKTCLCQGLSTAAYLVNSLLMPNEERAVSICPGPNLIWFKGIFALEQMIGHIYGKKSLITVCNRPNLFMNELFLYVEHLRKYVTNREDSLSNQSAQYVRRFSEALHQGILYYRSLMQDVLGGFPEILNNMKENLKQAEETLYSLGD